MFKDTKITPNVPVMMLDGVHPVVLPTAEDADCCHDAIFEHTSL